MKDCVPETGEMNAQLCYHMNKLHNCIKRSFQKHALTNILCGQNSDSNVRFK